MQKITSSFFEQDYTRDSTAPESDQALSTPWYPGRSAKAILAPDARQPSTLPSEPKLPGVNAYEVDFDRSLNHVCHLPISTSSPSCLGRLATQMTEGIDSVHDANAQIWVSNGKLVKSLSHFPKRFLFNVQSPVQPFRSEIQPRDLHILPYSLIPSRQPFTPQPRPPVLHALQHLTRPSAPTRGRSKPLLRGTS